MATEYFLKLDGIEGESQKAGFEKQIEVLNFTGGVANHSMHSVGGGSGSGKADVQDLVITKYVDSASVPLWVASASGTHIATGVLTARVSGGDSKPYTYYTLELTQVFINSVQHGGASGGADKFQETVSMTAGSLKHTYNSQTDKGTVGQPKVGGWNVVKNTRI